LNCREIAAVDWDSLSRSCTSFYRWLYRWYKQTGDVSPSTRYFARKQGKTTRTVYRWLSDLESAGAIIRQVEQGVERSIVPLVPPPSAEKCHRSCHPKCHRSIPYDADTQETQQHQARCVESSASKLSGLGGTQSQSATPVQSIAENPPRTLLEKRISEDLISAGVAVPVALHLVATEPERAAEQLAALPYRQAKDRAAVLVASIKQSWPIPEAFKAAVARKQKEAAEAQNRALRSELAKKRESTRLDTKSAFCGLPDASRDDLLARADAALRAELPQAWRLMQNRPAEVRTAWVTARAVALMQG
jgi:hypothetical protein